MCVCVWVCKHRQPRTYSDTPHSDWGQHCKRGRSTICGYVQMVANCLLLHMGVCWQKRENNVHRVWSSVQRWKVVHKVVCPQFYTQSVPQLRVVRWTRTSSFNESYIIVLDCQLVLTSMCLCVCVCLFVCLSCNAIHLFYVYFIQM